MLNTEVRGLFESNDEHGNGVQILVLSRGSLE